MSASFYSSPLIGATTTLACFAHEIPHEIADYSILIRSGFTKRQAMQSQFLTAVGAFVSFVVLCTPQSLARLFSLYDRYHCPSLAYHILVRHWTDFRILIRPHLPPGWVSLLYALRYRKEVQLLPVVRSWGSRFTTYRHLHTQKTCHPILRPRCGKPQRGYSAPRCSSLTWCVRLKKYANEMQIMMNHGCRLSPLLREGSCTSGLWPFYQRTLH